MESRFRFMIKLNEYKASLQNEITFLDKLINTGLFNQKEMLLKPLKTIDNGLTTLIKALFTISNGNGMGNEGLVHLKFQCDQYVKISAKDLPPVLQYSLTNTQLLCKKLHSELKNVPPELTQADEDEYQRANQILRARM